MQPHDRLVRAEFWLDRQFLHAFSWMERTFYQGLWSLADDSGCLYDDPGDIKHELARYDDDIKADWIAATLDKLVEQGRAVRYQVNGEPCIWLVNFSKHQTVKNPRAPEVPLPPWLSWVPYESNPSAGKYQLSEKILREFLESAEAQLRNVFYSHSDSDSDSQKSVCQSAREETAATSLPAETARAPGWKWAAPELKPALAAWRASEGRRAPPEPLADETTEAMDQGMTAELAAHIVGEMARRARLPTTDPDHVGDEAAYFRGIADRLLGADPPVTTLQQFQERETSFQQRKATNAKGGSKGGRASGTAASGRLPTGEDFRRDKYAEFYVKAPERNVSEVRPPGGTSPLGTG